MCFRIDFLSRDNNIRNMLIMTMCKVSEQSHEHRHNCFLHFKWFHLVLCSDLQIKPRVLGVTGFITADKGGDVTLECFFSGKWVVSLRPNVLFFGAEGFLLLSSCVCVCVLWGGDEGECVCVCVCAYVCACACVCVCVRAPSLQLKIRKTLTVPKLSLKSL